MMDIRKKALDNSKIGTFDPSLILEVIENVGDNADKCRFIGDIFSNYAHWLNIENKKRYRAEIFHEVEKEVMEKIGRQVVNKLTL